MLSALKDRIRNSPLAYDTLKAVKRKVNGKSDPAFQFFKEWSTGRDINFIQVGAADGLRNDPFREFILKGWRGILVEPLPDVFRLLQRNYVRQKDYLIFVNAAITTAENLSFWGISEEFMKTLPLEERLDYQRKASFDRAHVEHYFADKSLCRHITEVKIQCLTMSALLEKHWNDAPVHLLAIDAEGHEPDIINSIDFKAFRPEVIFYEDHTLAADAKRSVEATLHDNGYQLKRILGDTVAMRG